MSKRNVVHQVDLHDDCAKIYIISIKFLINKSSIIRLTWDLIIDSLFYSMKFDFVLQYEISQH